MRIIKNINSATACALYNKGVDTLRAALDSLPKISGKKMENYLVVPNNCILSLSLSRRAGLNNTFFLHSYAREACCNPCKQRTPRSFLCSLFCAVLSVWQKTNKN